MKDNTYNTKKPVPRDEGTEWMAAAANGGSHLACMGSNNTIIGDNNTMVVNINPCCNEETLLRLLDVISSQREEIARLHDLICKYHETKQHG